MWFISVYLQNRHLPPIFIKQLCLTSKGEADQLTSYFGVNLRRTVLHFVGVRSDVQYADRFRRKFTGSSRSI